jgi:hypothetical protein
MGIKTNLNIAPYFDDYDVAKKYYRVLFKPGYAVQARELTQLQTTLQNQIEQFGANIYKEGSIIKGCTFTELRNLKYVKVVDGIRPEDYIERTEVQEDGTIDEYYYEIEDEFELKALIVQGTSGFQSRDPDLNTFFVVYLNSADTGNFEKKSYEAGDTLNIREYILRTQEVDDEITETIIDNGIVETTSVTSFSDPVGDSFGLNASEGIIFQRGHFLFVDDQTIVVKKYLSDETVEFELEPNNISVGYIVDEAIITSQQDQTLLDNANGSPNENAPGADRLYLVPRLIARATVDAEADSEFFILRRYENGEPVETRDVSQFNSISKELARRTYEAHGDFTTKTFNFEVYKREIDEEFFVEMSEGSAYSKGYRVTNDTKRVFRVPDIQETATITMQPINFSYGGFVQIVDVAGVLPLRTFQTVDLIDAGLTVIGSAIVKNMINDKIYLFGIRMSGSNEFVDVQYIGSNVSGRIEITPKVINSSESRLVFSSNKAFVRGLTDVEFSIRKTTNTTTNGSGQIEIVPASGEVFDANSLRDVVVIITTGIDELVTDVTPSIGITGNLIIDTDAISENVAVHYNAKQTELEPRVKQVLNVFVKTTYSSSQSRYTLGLPDVFSLLEVKDNLGDDYTSSFKLVNNQRDDFYDHSYIEKIPGTPTPPNGQLTIRVKVFRIDTSVGINFFTVDSYDAVSLLEIPNFETQDGRVLDLKSCLDFRPYRTAVAAYSTTEGGATVIANTGVSLPSSITQLFESGIDYIVPAINTSGSATIEYYTRRTDFIIGSSYGSFQYIAGSDTTAVRTINGRENTVIAEINIPGYPLLSPQEAFRLNRKDEAISIKRRTVQTYTMKDIDNLTKKIDTLTYYTTLSLLEAATRNLLVQDENGLNRFKNGIIVDPFVDFNIADVTDANFSAGINPSETSLIPKFKQFPLALKVSNNNGTQTFGEITTLPSNRVVRFLNQQYATSFRTCTSNKYSFVGNGAITPAYDVAYDTVTTPVNLEIDISRPFIDFTNALSEIVPLTRTDSTVNSSATETSTRRTASIDPASWGRGGTRTTTTTTQNITDVTSALQIGNTTLSQNVGDFVTDFRFSPFMRSRELQIEMYGLRPNTRHYVFFDEVDVNNNVAPGSFFDDLAIAPGEVRVVRSGSYGSPILTNSNGELFAVFKIPENQFLVGERELRIVDVDTIENVSSASLSGGSLKYNAYNFSVDKSGLTLSTRQPSFTIGTSTSNRTVVSRTVVSVIERDMQDPLAQTFFVKGTMARGAESVFLSGVDVFFKRKSETNGITIQIREVDNGYPTYEILPFASKHLRMDQVYVSEDASVATPIVFDAPVRLDAEKEYALILWPDADDPDYLAYTSKVGGTDFITKESVNADWGDGVLFTSTNNRAWTAYQDEDLKFSLYRHNFSLNSGTVEMETHGHEFLEIGAVSGGSFINGELVYAPKGVTTYPVVANTSTTVVTGTGLGNYDQGDYFLVEDGGNKELLKVVTVVSPTQIVVNRPPTLSGSLLSQPVVAGEVTYFNPRSPEMLILEKSSARASRPFASGDAITGIDSGAVSSVTDIANIELSYMQSMVNRVTDSNSNVKIAVKAIDPLFPSDPPYTSPFEFSSDKKFNEKGCIIYSKSNDLTQEKNLKIVMTLEKDDIPTTTPIVDTGVAQLFAYINLITNDPNTTSRYISKKVELAEGFDSEDFRLFVSGYRPIGTDIRAYIRVKNEADPVSLSNNDWIELEKIAGETLFSSTSNTDDLKEFVFSIPVANKDVNDVVTYTNETGTYYGYRAFAVRIDLLSSNVASVPRVMDYRGIAFE